MKTASIELCSRKNGGQNTSGPDTAKSPREIFPSGFFQFLQFMWRYRQTVTYRDCNIRLFGQEVSRDFPIRIFCRCQGR